MMNIILTTIFLITFSSNLLNASLETSQTLPTELYEIVKEPLESENFSKEVIIETPLFNYFEKEFTHEHKKYTLSVKTEEKQIRKQKTKVATLTITPKIKKGCERFLASFADKQLLIMGVIDAGGTDYIAGGKDVFFPEEEVDLKQMQIDFLKMLKENLKIN